MKPGARLFIQPFSTPHRIGTLAEDPSTHGGPMHDIQRALTTASRRLFLNAFFRAVVVMTTVSASVLLALVAIEKLSPFSFGWAPIGWSALGITLATALLAAWIRRPKGIALADELDRRAGLRETLSTAVALHAKEVGNADQAWALAVKESAAERANRIVMRDAVPVRPPRGWQTPALLLVVAGLGLWLAPRHDLSGLLDRQAAEDEQQAEIRTVALEIKSREDDLKEVLDRAGIEMEEDDASDDEAAEQDKPTSPEELRRSALKKLTKLSDQLSEKMSSEQAEQTKALQENIERLKTPGPGPMTEFARSLARGQFKNAKDALEELGKSIEAGEMSDEQKMQSAQQLESLAEQMEKLAQNKEALKQQLEKQGMDPSQAEKLAGDPEALKQALEKMENMSAAQKQQLMKNVTGQMESNLAMQSMAQSLGKMAKEMQAACENPGSNPGQKPGQSSGQGGQQGQMSQGMSEGMAQAMQQMSDQLSACEMASAEMQTLSMAMSECKNQMAGYGQSLCENPGTGKGKGRGGKKAGEGDAVNEFDAPLAASDDYILKAEKVQVANHGGPIIGSTMVYGAQVKGEATAQFGQAVGASSVQAAEAIESMRVPREYHDAVRAYFGRLEKIAKETESTDGSAPEN